MYENITTLVQIDGERSKEFEVKVRVYQGSVLSPLLFAIVMDEITKDVRENGVKKLPNVDDLVLLRNCRKEVEKKAMTEKV